MLGPIASPVSFAGSKRYNGNMLHIIDEMPAVDTAVVALRGGLPYRESLNKNSRQ